MTTRRRFLQQAGALAVGMIPARWLFACAAAPPASGARLQSRPHRPRKSISPGVHSVGLSTSRDTQLVVPASYRADRPATLILGLHGATQDSEFIMYILRDAAERAGHLLLAPNSRDVTWDVVRGHADEDERLLDAALEWTFDRCDVDPARVVLAGFSDGATVALSLGLINGDLFNRIVAFSPGFIVGDERNGHPRIFVSHGTNDQILPIDQTSRRIVPMLQRSGYDVTFREFDGPHRAPREIVAEAMKWMG
jgi:phospholipase/carboxylesterase